MRPKQQSHGAGSGLNDPWLLVALWTLAVIGLAGAARLLWWYWPGRVFDGLTSGIWTALAWDLAHGDFYRPLLGPHGYGGTRYMPLLFVAQAMLMHVGVDPIHSGVVLMQGSVIAAAVALYFALRACDVPARLAARRERMSHRWTAFVETAVTAGLVIGRPRTNQRKPSTPVEEDRGGWCRHAGSRSVPS
jgi:hypothetical protein